MLCFIFLFSLLLSTPTLQAALQSKIHTSTNQVCVQLEGQLGNQLFQIATAYAYSLDHNLPFSIPDLVQKTTFGIPHNAKELFLPKIPSYTPGAPLLIWKEPTYNYSPIPFYSQIELRGYFQSERYFAHRRNEIVDLFSPPDSIKQTILTKYPLLLSGNLTVGVQIRDYRKELPSGDFYALVERKYFTKAFALFPENTLFFVSSNNPSFAKECTEGLAQNIIHLNETDYILEFYALTLCKSFIISNSTFGWWAAWLGTDENKVVIAPDPWFAPPLDNETMKQDLFPATYHIIRH